MFQKRTAVKAAILTLLASAGTAHAASYLDSGYKLRKGEKTSYSPSLAELTQSDIHHTTRTLDWRQPSLQLWFDLPASEKTSEITLRLSADPLTTVPAHTPLMIQFNHDKPVPVVSNGNGFEATLSFDTALARARRNSLRITFPAPTGTDCVSPAHGQWSIDLAESSLTLKGRAKTGHMSLTELQARLAQPAFAPKRIGLIAKGPEATDMQALAAQGLALRMTEIPSFSVTDNGTDFNMVMVKRSDLFAHTDDPMILNSKGARLFIPKGRPTELIVTADTDAEILETLKLFSTRHLPKARRPITSLGEIDMQSRLDDNRVRVDRKIRLSELAHGHSGPRFGEEGWTSGASAYQFDIADPVATQGELLLRLSSNPDLADTSRLRVALNGDVLGAARLDKPRKSVIFDIPAGRLQASSNQISLLPELEAGAGYECASAQQNQPNVIIGNGSKLILNTARSSPVTELSRFTATAGLFAEAESYIVLPDRSRDYEASLRILARLAKSAGQGLIQADYTRRNRIGTDRHVLAIGPASQQFELFGDMAMAPKVLREALKGRAVTGDNLLNAEIERFASADSNNFAFQKVAAQTGPRKVTQGGIAALYGNESGKMTAIISASPRASFSTAARQLVSEDHWNAVRGGVALWDSASVLMAQTALPVDGLSLPETPGTNWGRFTLPELDMPDWDWPQVKLPQFDWPSFARTPASGETTPQPLPVTDDIKAQNLSPKESSAPNFGAPTPVAMSEREMKRDPSDGLRGRFTFETPDLPSIDTSRIELPKIASFHNIKRETKIKWRATQRWTQKKIDDLMTLRTLKSVEQRIERAQSKIKPSGQKARQGLLERLPGQGVIRYADKTYSVFGVLLILSFISVVILMSMASPSSRLGGRH